MWQNAQAVANRKALRGRVERSAPLALVMSHTRPARLIGWNLRRAGLGARVAGADVAIPSPDAGYAGAWLVPGAIPAAQLAFPLAIQLETTGVADFGWVHRAGGGALGPAVRRTYWAGAHLDTTVAMKASLPLKVTPACHPEPVEGSPSGEPREEDPSLLSG